MFLEIEATWMLCSQRIYVTDTFLRGKVLVESSRDAKRISLFDSGLEESTEEESEETSEDEVPAKKEPAAK